MGRPREITDQEILTQARECFLEAGPTLSAAAIARKLGISEGTLFNRFSTKEQLMRRALGVPEPRWVELLVNDPPDLHAQLVRVASSLLSFFQEAMPAMNLLRAAGLRPDHPETETTEPPPKRLHRELTQWLEREQMKGRLANRSPAVRAQALIGSLHAHAMMRHIWGQTMVELDDATYAHQLVDTLFHELSESSEEHIE